MAGSRVSVATGWAFGCQSRAATTSPPPTITKLLSPSTQLEDSIIEGVIVFSTGYHDANENVSKGPRGKVLLYVAEYTTVTLSLWSIAPTQTRCGRREQNVLARHVF